MDLHDVGLESYQTQFDKFTEIIRAHWPNWDYHNFDEHGLETYDEFMLLASYVSDNGIALSEAHLVAGALTTISHDVGNGWGQPYFYEYYEDRSGAVAEGTALYCGFSKQIAALIFKATQATRPGATCETPLEKMVRRADIANFAWPYDRFRQKTVAVWRETQKTCAEPLSFRQWLPKATPIVLQLLSEDLALGDFDRGASGQSHFYEASFANFQMLDDEVESPDFVEPELYRAA